VTDPGAVVVTGGGGFIGSHLLEHLDHRDVTVRALMGPDDAPGTPAPDRCSATTGEVTDDEVVGRLVRGADVVIHLAGPASVASSFRSPEQHLAVHAGGALAVCRAAADAGVRRVVLVSSAEVYGQPTGTPVSEHAPLLPRSPYGAAKVAAEAVAGAWVRSGALGEVVVVRPFSVYGPRMSAWSLIGGLLHAARTGAGPLSVRDPGVVRDVVHVEDLVQGLAAAASAPMEADVTTLNLCSGRGTSAAELRDLVAELAGAPVCSTPAEADRPSSADVRLLVGDTTRAAQALGWSARTPLREGLAAALQDAGHPSELSAGGAR
jgi:UDP-glucose 4-epimerase